MQLDSYTLHMMHDLCATLEAGKSRQFLKIVNFVLSSEMLNFAISLFRPKQFLSLAIAHCCVMAHL